MGALCYNDVTIIYRWCWGTYSLRWCGEYVGCSQAPGAQQVSNRGFWGCCTIMT
jgi:hypothetical protein